MKKTFIIAEAGVNHNGELIIAEKMIQLASEAGADAIKFQTFKSENLVSKTAQKAEYQKKNTRIYESQFDMLKKLEFDKKSHEILINLCKKYNIRFISSPFDLESIDLLNSFELKIFKIPSGEITNSPYLRKIGSLNKYIILSTGMSDLDEIKDSVDILTGAGTSIQNITILHCNTEYPTPYEDVNLKAMVTIKSSFSGIEIGYSDHTPGIEIPIAAVAMGATVIEKHFTLDMNMEGTDHKASLEPADLKKMITSIRNIEKAMGNGIKKSGKSELKNRKIARKSITAAQYIKKGEVFTEENITVKRPGTGISPMKWDEIIGAKADKNYKNDDMI